jgi:DNA modification methylase
MEISMQKPSTQPANVIVDRPPSELKPWPGNPRTHSDKQLFKLKASIRRFGFTGPVLVDENSVILAGHGRVQAAMSLGLVAVPTLVISGLTEAMKSAYVIADNKIPQLAGWDPELLRAQIEILIQQDFDVETTGFSTAEIDLMMDGDPRVQGSDPDDLRIDDTVVERVSRLGDLWQLGKHRLLCGDALQMACYSRLMQGELAQMVFTDPPYNVRIDGHVGGSGKIKHPEFAMASGEMSRSEFTAFLNKALTNLRAYSQDGAIHFVCIDWRHIGELLEAAMPLFGDPKQLCVWAKQNAGMGSFYRSQHEMVFAFKQGDAPHINNFELGQHGRYRSNLWSYPGVNSFGRDRELLAVHPTVKPTGLVADAFRDCSHRKGIILDPFAGSGTVLVAAERTGRHARAIEFDPHYVDVAVMRWQRVTGEKAVLTTTGEPWEAVRARSQQRIELGKEDRAQSDTSDLLGQQSPPECAVTGGER